MLIHRFPWLISLLLSIIFFFPNVSFSTQEQRLALLIGNSNYTHGGSLDNPVNDVRAIKKALEGLGFTVMKYEDCSQKTMKRAMDKFGRKLKGKNVGLFFYAGHGVQVNGHNYLLPADAKLDNANDAEYDCVRADRVLAKMESAGSKTNIVILDACRDNPFERSWRRGAEGTGLAFMNAPSGSLIAYSTAPGKTALDGRGKNSPYTAALLKHISTPDITALQMFQIVRSSVIELSNQKQTPWESTSLRGDFYFAAKGKNDTSKVKTGAEAETYVIKKPEASNVQKNQTQHLRESKKSGNIEAFRHSKGVFKRQSDGRWYEYWTDPFFSFVEASRDNTWLYLRDDSRKIDLKFPIKGGWCKLRRNNSPWGNLYLVNPEYDRTNDIIAFKHSKGVFRRQNNSMWFEYANDATFSFIEASRDSTWLYLRDDSRKIDLKFPIKGGWCKLRRNNSPWGNLYLVNPE